jgi:hypothetical protein
MDEASITQYITGTFEGIDAVVADGNTFFFYDPDRNVAPDRRFPFVTLVTNDQYDTASNLRRPGVFRLNIGVSKATFGALFPPEPSPPREEGVGTVHDFTALDQIMPHPVYGKMCWICVLNPSPTTFERVQPLLAESYQRARHKAP